MKKPDLDDHILGGLMPDIMHAEEAVAIATAIGAHSERLRRTRFNSLFGTLQVALSEVDTLAVARLFDAQEKNRYPVRSVYAVLRHLEANAASLVVENPAPIANAAGISEDDVLRDPAAATLTLCAHFRQRLETGELSTRLERVQFARDKVLAHNEAKDPEKVQKLFWDDTRHLLSFAKEFLIIVAGAYRNMPLAHRGEYEFTWDAQVQSRYMDELIRLSLPLIESTEGAE